MGTIDVTREAFNSKQTCAIVEATLAKIRYWDRQGLAKPSIRPASGRGSRRLYSYRDLLALQTIKRLRDEGLSLQRIRTSVRYLRKKLPDICQPLGFCTLISGPETVYLVTSEAELIDTVKRQGQHVFTQLNISGLEHALRKKVISLALRRVEEVAVGEFCYQVDIEPDVDDGGYVATVAGLPGCITDGDTLEEVLEMAVDAITCWLEAYEELEKQGIKVPMKKGRRRRLRA